VRLKQRLRLPHCFSFSVTFFFSCPMCANSTVIIFYAGWVCSGYFFENCFAVSAKAFFREHRECTQGTGLLVIFGGGGKKALETHLQHFSNPAIGIISNGGWKSARNIEYRCVGKRETPKSCL
jgi:hypothetical protein